MRPITAPHGEELHGGRLELGDVERDEIPVLGFEAAEPATDQCGETDFQ
jgi:hypothetical protein